MIPVSKAVEEIVISTPYLEEGFASGIINISALARAIRPGVQKRLYKQHISEGALVMALNRFQPKIRRKASLAKLFSRMENITVRSNIVEIILPNSPAVDQVRKELTKLIFSQRDTFFNFIQGIRESTFLISKNLEHAVAKLVSGKATAKIDNLSSITISLPPENRKTPGVYYLLLKTLAWNDINLVEVVSSYNELTLIFDNASVDKAFSLVKALTTRS